jgi:hypothetical protein
MWSYDYTILSKIGDDETKVSLPASLDPALPVPESVDEVADDGVVVLKLDGGLALDLDQCCKTFHRRNL